MKLSKLFVWRKLSFPLAALVFNALRLNCFRDRKIWLFGCWMGKKYDDNSKFLFEYVCKNHPEIRCIWITRDNRICRYVRDLGYECCTSFSLKGIAWMLRGGVAIMTNGLDDFCPIPLIGGAKIVALWHGVGGFKKIYNENYSGIKLFLKKKLDLLFSWTHRDISLGTSKYTAERIMEQFGCSESSIMITGQPRNDIFHEKMARGVVLGNLWNEDFAKIVLYMPTYRVNLDTHEDVVMKIVEELRGDGNFLNYLARNGILFLVKLHPLTKMKTEKSLSNFKILGDENVISVQHLLMAADCLVTDYSSCCVDYALLKRPVVFFVPDEKDYLSRFPLNGAYFKVVREKATTVGELMVLLSTGNTNQTDLLNDIFEDPTIKNTCYCENTYKGICSYCEEGS